MSTSSFGRSKFALYFRMALPRSFRRTLPSRRRKSWASISFSFLLPLTPLYARSWTTGSTRTRRRRKKNEAKKKQHRMEVKEVKFRPNTDDHDYNFKKNHTLRFLKEGNKVKAVVFFRGREITHSDLGHKILTNLAKDVDDFGEIEGRAAARRSPDACHHRPAEDEKERECARANTGYGLVGWVGFPPVDRPGVIASALTVSRESGSSPCSSGNPRGTIFGVGLPPS